ncbi:hypothetical protein BN159_8498 [Streptomyces davaonensis JCM 4913]|uniref:Uncharacterized protein n=1 Tax=Streptomyces davaonensis (strain DSM 101723 / JCM 4913 / KCC S-0913 / 768) TaxID=1214101 RepID=K4R9D9_STRDJ|nr:hypothetical protein [Streptomyces davaonensis]CCK24386.1 hypothetical protein BN159_0007 [Streptomyces davaonensis JCM 4913]CCK32876.1 hypothetical protein BN159_8498 [Streptomyces davaonensis JCM 4913]
MPEPQLPRPDDAATASAMGRALHALTALLPALGEGSHELSINAERTDGTEMRASLYVTVEPGSWRVHNSPEEYVHFFVLLTFALEHSTVRDAVLVATTANAGIHACGWDVRNGWLHPMDTSELQEAAAAFSVPDAASLVVCHAPVLHRPHQTAEKHS